ncbi:MAG: hypothetical protein ACKVP2_03475 [Burkholderiales bacterium]
MRILLIALFAIVLAACATTADVMRIDNTNRGASDPATIRVFLDEPSQPYTTVAMVRISDQGWGLSLEDLKAAMIKEAAKLGGDAVIVGTETRNAGTAFVPIGTMLYGVESPEKILVGKVIEFLDHH